MEIVYRIFTWIISGTAWLLLMLVFAPFEVITLDCWIKKLQPEIKTEATEK